MKNEMGYLFGDEDWEIEERLLSSKTTPSETDLYRAKEHYHRLKKLDYLSEPSQLVLVGCDIDRDFYFKARTEKVTLAKENIILLLNHPNGMCSFGYYAKWENGSCSVLPLLNERHTKPSREEAAMVAYEWIRKTLDKAPTDLKREIERNFLAKFPPRKNIRRLSYQ